MSPLEVHEGVSPVILTFPHGGVHIAENLMRRLNPVGLQLADTDWHIHRLYDGLLDQATTVRATFHRYVIDANRAPDGHSLYPGQNTTELCPLTDFNGQNIWQDGQAPGAAEVAERRHSCHAPYHKALADQIDRIKNRHGVALIYDCHSIRSRIPHLFEGPLPDFNIGTNDGASCASSIESTVLSQCRNATGFTHVLNGRFKGGWTTRHYGNPAQGIHVVQMELAQLTYMMESPPWTLDRPKADAVREHLKIILTRLNTLALEGR